MPQPYYLGLNFAFYELFLKILSRKANSVAGEEISSIFAYFKLVSSLDTQLFQKLSVSDTQNVFPIRESPPLGVYLVCLHLSL